MRHTDYSIVDELRLAEYVLRRLGAPDVTRALLWDERLRISEALRNAADQIDHGHGDLRGSPPPAHMERPPVGHVPAGATVDIVEPPSEVEVVPVRVRSTLPRSRIRPVGRPAKPRTMAGN